jgi:hypothetical protein
LIMLIADTARTVDERVIPDTRGKHEFQIDFIVQTSFVANFAKWFESTCEQVALHRQSDCNNEGTRKVVRTL